MILVQYRYFKTLLELVYDTKCFSFEEAQWSDLNWLKSVFCLFVWLV